MHRLQSVIFNLVFGVIFIAYLITKKAFPDFSDTELALLGVSSGAYLALKTNENKVVAATLQPNDTTENPPKKTI